MRSAWFITAIALISALARVPAAAQVPAPADAGVTLVEHARDARQQQSLRSPAWQTALVGSLGLLAIEHGLRIAFDENTRRELKGPFFRDWLASVHVPEQWEDGDSWIVNYIGHPIHGAAAGYLYRDAAGVTSQDFSLRPSYWADLGKASAWVAGYSLQFEFGPLSEASIGNVGRAPETRGWVDHVVTPVMGFALMAVEDALDRFVVQLVERHTGNRFFRASVRMIFNPARVLSNVAQGELPWARPGRPIGR